MSAWLEDSQGNRFEIEDRCTIGRLADNNIVLPDARVSRWHALVHRVAPAIYWIVDFGSRNGLYLNGRRLTEPGVLCDGDEVEIGEHRLRFHNRGASRRGRANPNGLKERTEPAADAHAATAHGIILLGGEADVQYMTEQSREWLKEYFEEETTEHELPSRLRQWLRDSPPKKHPRAMTLRRGDKRLLVRRSEDQQMLLLIEEQSVFAPAMVEVLGLTGREGEVLRWLAEGKTSPEIGTILEASPRTVEKHIQHIFDKLGVDNRAAAVLRAVDLIQRRR